MQLGFYYYEGIVPGAKSRARTEKEQLFRPEIEVKTPAWALVQPCVFGLEYLAVST